MKKDLVDQGLMTDEEDDEDDEDIDSNNETSNVKIGSLIT
jgi:hypothetical protein